MAGLFAAVAGERTGIATEPPVDISERAALFAGSTSGSLVAEADCQLIGLLHVEVSRHGFGELGCSWTVAGVAVGSVTCQVTPPAISSDSAARSPLANAS